MRRLARILWCHLSRSHKWSDWHLITEYGAYLRWCWRCEDEEWAWSVPSGGRVGRPMSEEKALWIGLSLAWRRRLPIDKRKNIRRLEDLDCPAPKGVPADAPFGDYDG